jgi:hypothetical protein
MTLELRFEGSRPEAGDGGERFELHGLFQPSIEPSEGAPKSGRQLPTGVLLSAYRTMRSIIHVCSLSTGHRAKRILHYPALAA